MIYSNINMFIINNTNKNPYFNAALEEYFLKQFFDEFVMFWQNKTSVVVGKHQNALNEINFDYLQSKKIPVVRRLTGGGTVFHDLNNINFTFIINGKEKNKLIDFKKYTQPIIDALHKLNVNAVFSERNDILIDRFKISGNAEHIFQKRVLHHGTLLFNANLETLRNSIKTEKKYADKAVKSVSSKVANIIDFLDKKMTTGQFKNHLEKSLKKQLNAKKYQLTEQDIDAINQLVTEKYQTWEWNFGYSPRYSLIKNIEINNKTITLNLTVKKGIIETINLEINNKKPQEFVLLERQLTNQPHKIEFISEQINEQTYTKQLFKTQKTIRQVFF